MLGTQRRYIINKNKVPKADQDEIKQQIKKEINNKEKSENKEHSEDECDSVKPPQS